MQLYQLHDPQVSTRRSAPCHSTSLMILSLSKDSRFPPEADPLKAETLPSSRAQAEGSEGLSSGRSRNPPALS